jgi:hypothetical protein
MDDMGNPMPKETSNHPKSQKLIQNSATLNERAPDTRCQRGYRTIHDFSSSSSSSPPPPPLTSTELGADRRSDCFHVHTISPIARSNGNPRLQAISAKSIKQSNEQADRQRGDRGNIAKHRQHRPWQQSKVQVRTS